LHKKSSLFSKKTEAFVILMTLFYSSFLLKLLSYQLLLNHSSDHTWHHSKTFSLKVVATFLNKEEEKWIPFLSNEFLFLSCHQIKISSREMETESNGKFIKRSSDEQWRGKKRHDNGNYDDCLALSVDLNRMLFTFFFPTIRVVSFEVFRR
jgi:hypothetical protein